ncbi:MAG TPA: hypothetical protein DCM62_01635 [Bacteroidales bacterium]|nr:hypothetical protein [Bacteroidales bacterium]
MIKLQPVKIQIIPSSIASFDAMRRSAMHIIALLNLLFVMLMGNAHSAQARATPNLQVFRDQIYDAYVLNNMPQWARTLQAMEAAYRATPSAELLYDLLLAQYGIIGYYLGNNRQNLGEPILKRAEALNETLEQTRGFQAQASAFQAAFIAFRISLSPARAIIIGPRSANAANRAEQLNPQYPRVWVEKGNIQFFAPAPFGSKRQSITYYQRAIRLMEANMHPSHRWLYLSTLVSLANAFEKTGNIAMAIQTLEKALQFEPRFSWAKDEMLPRLRAGQ